MITTLLGSMSEATANEVARYAGYLTLLCVLPLCILTLLGRAHPAAVTWGLWAPIGFVATIGMAFGGAPFGAWFPKLCLSSGPLLVFICAAVKGQWRADPCEHPRTVATIGIVGTIAYVAIYSGAIGPADAVLAGQVAVLAAILVDTVGAWPTWVRAWRNPHGELISTYALAWVSVSSALLNVAP